MYEFIIEANECLNQKIRAFYHTDYVPGNHIYLNDLKNTFGTKTYYGEPIIPINNAAQELEKVLLEDLPQIFQKLQINPLTVCVVPRAKEEKSYEPNQLRFKSTVRAVVKQLNNGFCDGADYIIRHTDTKTTHLFRSPSYAGNGPYPYPGITIDTCTISAMVKGRDILLIDDIYTETVNIDEDVIQALLTNGAKSVAFYAVGKTIWYYQIMRLIF